jgi:hypothetical protein
MGSSAAENVAPQFELPVLRRAILSPPVIKKQCTKADKLQHNQYLNFFAGSIQGVNRTD